ncbi:MAG: hypothetical protein WAZ21_04165 [Candidatus Saccharimonadales bacterium]
MKTTFSYSGGGPGGWNLSSSATWLAFLGTTYGKIPVDPINNGTTDPMLAGFGSAYYYYCYPAGQGPMPATANVRLGYRSDVTGQNVNTDISVEKCL